MASSSPTTAEPHPKKAKVEKEERMGWDLQGEFEYCIYWGDRHNEMYTYPDLEDLDQVVYANHFNEARASKGFDVTSRAPDRNVGFFLILPDSASEEANAKTPNFVKFLGYDYHVEAVNRLAPAAVTIHNEKTGAQLQFVCWVKANFFKAWGFFHFITLVAKDNRTDEFKKCLTRVCHYPDEELDPMCYTVESFSIAGDAPPDPLPIFEPEPLRVELIHFPHPMRRFNRPS